MVKDLEWLTSKHEWVTDGLTKISAVDTGNLSDKFTGPLKHDEDMLFFTFQVPEVLMGRGNVPEGLAEVSNGCL